MIQNIFIILNVFRSEYKEQDFASFIEDGIKEDIKPFLPDGVDYSSYTFYPDKYIDRIFNQILSKYLNSINEDMPPSIGVERKILNFTFTSEEDIRFKQIPWLEEFVLSKAEEYYNILIIFPYLIKTDSKYSFITPRKFFGHNYKNDDSISKFDNFPLLQNAAPFFKHHFYKEDIPENCFPVMAKVLLLNEEGK